MADVQTELGIHTDALHTSEPARGFQQKPDRLPENITVNIGTVERNVSKALAAPTLLLYQAKNNAFASPIEVAYDDPVLADKLPANVEPQMRWAVIWEVEYKKSNGKNALVKITGDPLKIEPIEFTQAKRDAWETYVSRLIRTYQIPALQLDGVIRAGLGGRTIEEWLASGRDMGKAQTGVSGAALMDKDRRDSAAAIEKAKADAEKPASDLDQYFDGNAHWTDSDPGLVQFGVTFNCGPAFALGALIAEYGEIKNKWLEREICGQTVIAAQEAIAPLLGNIPDQSEDKSVTDQAVATPFIKIDAERKAFWAEANKILCQRKDLATMKPAQRHKIVHELLGVEHMEDYLGTRKLAIEELTEMFEIEYPADKPAEPAKPASNSAAEIAVKVGAMLNEAFPTASSEEKSRHFKQATGFAKVADAYTELGTAQIIAVLGDHIKAELEKPFDAPPAKEESKPAKTPPTNGHKAQSDDPADLKREIREKYNAPQRGKDYLMVAGRVMLFRADHPDWTIETDPLLLTEQTAIYKATIRNPEGRVIATGSGRATEAGTKSLGGRYVEKAETAAIGRALALAGFGTDDTLDDTEYLADAPLEKKSA